jgi:cardiolipin synthase
MSSPRIPWRFRLVRERFVADNRVTLLRDGVEAYPAMLEAIAAAKQEILLEMYWFASDRIGRRFVAALAAAAARGVRVAVIYDAVGSIDTDPALFAELADAGIRVLEYNPIKPWSRRFRLDRLTRRDHRKVLTVDGLVGFTGGINVADQWLSEAEGGQGWRDDMVRVEGPAVAGFMRLFHHTWVSQGGERLAPPCAPTPRRGQRRSTERPPSDPSREGGQRVRVLGESTRKHRRQIVRAYLANIYRAKHRVWIANSYFVPDGSVVRALRRAAERGVDVRVLVPGKSDVEIVRHASRAVWARLMEHGVRIYEWQENVFHAKTAVIDGEWSTLGTFNLDYWSLRYNLEVNVSVRDPGFGALMEASFERDFAAAREVTRASFDARRTEDRVLEALLYRVRKLL